MQTTVLTSKATTPIGAEPAARLRRRIGSTVYVINVYADRNATETAERKLLRIIEGEVNQTA